MDTDGENVRRVPRGGDTLSPPEWPSWPIGSRDGASIYLRTSLGEIITMGADGTDRRRLTSFERGNRYMFRWFAVSPDERSLAIVEGEYEREEVVVVDVPGGGRRVVVSDPLAYHDAPAWSPDGRRIAYTSIYAAGFERRGRADIHVVNLDDLSVTRLTNSRDYDGMPAWEPASAWEPAF